MTSTMTTDLHSPDLAATLPDFDPSVPTYEIWIDDARFASTQVPARAKAMYTQMTTGAAGKRYGLRTVEIRVANDRREVAR